MKTTVKLVACFTIVTLVACTAWAEDSNEQPVMLSGSSCVIHFKGGGGGPTPLINVGGLLVIEVSDIGSRPPKDLKVETSRTFQRLGQVRGVKTDPETGKPLMGAGYTWVLCTPKNASESEEIKVTVEPYSGDLQTATYKIQVVPGNFQLQDSRHPAK